MPHRWASAALAVAVSGGVAGAAPGDIETYAGGRVGDGDALATAVVPWGAALDGTDLYFADFGSRVVRRLDLTTGQQFVVAGDGSFDYAAPEGPAKEVSLSPSAVTFDLDGDLLIADTLGYVLELDAATGLLRVLAGGGTEDIRWNGDLSTARLGPIMDIVVEPDGRLLICNFDGFVYRLDLVAGTGQHVAGSDTFSNYLGDGGPATAAGIREPWDLEIDAAGNIYIADNMNERVRRIDATTGIITTWVGGGVLAPADGALAHEVDITGVLALDIAANGDLVFGERHGPLWRVDSVTREMTRLAGTDEEGPLGDGGPALDASLGTSATLFVTTAGDIFIGSYTGARIRWIEGATGIIETIAGTGSASFGGDGGPASLAKFYRPRGIGFAPDGTLYISDRYNHRVRRVDPVTQIIDTFMGTGEPGNYPIDQPPLLAHVEEPYDVAAGPLGDVVVNASPYGGRVLAYNPVTNIVERVAYSGGSEGLTFDPLGRLVVASLYSRRVVRVDPFNGERTTLAGSGAFGDPIEGELATVSPFREPIDVGFDSLGRLVVLDRGATVWRIDADDGRLEFLASVSGGTRMALDAYDNLFVVRESYSDVLRIDTETGETWTVAGISRSSGFSGDGGPATDAQLRRATDVAVGPDGHLYIADAYNHRIRRVDLTASCGDGYVTGAEGCDDGGLEDGDGCDSACKVEPFWSCKGSPSTCALPPAQQCREAERPSVLVRGGVAGKEQVNFDWKRGATTDATAFGDPVTTTTSELVVWDQDGARLRLRAIAPPGDGWRQTKKGFRRAMPSGLRRVLLRSGEDGKARIVVRAKGAELGVPEILDFEPPMIVQWLRRDDPSQCWTARFEEPLATTPFLFRARE